MFFVQSMKERGKNMTIIKMAAEQELVYVKESVKKLSGMIVTALSQNTMLKLTIYNDVCTDSTDVYLNPRQIEYFCEK